MVITDLLLCDSHLSLIFAFIVVTKGSILDGGARERSILIKANGLRPEIKNVVKTKGLENKKRK